MTNRTLVARVADHSRKVVSKCAPRSRTSNLTDNLSPSWDLTQCLISFLTALDVLKRTHLLGAGSCPCCCCCYRVCVNVHNTQGMQVYYTNCVQLRTHARLDLFAWDHATSCSADPQPNTLFACANAVTRCCSGKCWEPSGVRSLFQRTGA